MRPDDRVQPRCKVSPAPAGSTILFIGSKTIPCFLKMGCSGGMPVAVVNPSFLKKPTDVLRAIVWILWHPLGLTISTTVAISRRPIPLFCASGKTAMCRNSTSVPPVQTATTPAVTRPFSLATNSIDSPATLNPWRTSRGRPNGCQRMRQSSSSSASVSFCEVTGSMVNSLICFIS